MGLDIGTFMKYEELTHMSKSQFDAQQRHVKRECTEALYHNIGQCGTQDRENELRTNMSQERLDVRVTASGLQGTSVQGK